MRECPAWFQDQLTRIGGLNPYGEPVFKLVWSTEPKRVVGGRFANGFVGYRKMPLIPGTPAWALLVWEPCSAQGPAWRWEFDYRDPDTGLLDCGGYPHYGAYRLLQKFLHREIVQQAKEECCFDYKGNPRTRAVQQQKVVTYRMEPCGLMLDVMLPMLMAWRRLSGKEKLEAIRQDMRLQEEKESKLRKDVYQDCKLSRVMRGSQLVQKRAELIESGLRQAMAIAAHSGLGMQVMA